MTVSELLKKSLAFSLGAAAFSAEKLKQFADEMVSKGEITSDEAKKFVDEVSEKAEEEKKTIQEWMREQACRMLEQAGAARTERVDDLERRVANLERKMGITPPQAVRTSNQIPEMDDSSEGGSLEGDG